MSIDEIAKAVAQRIIGRVDANPEDYAEGIDEGNLIDSCIDEVYENLSYKKFAMVAEHPEVEAALMACEDIIKDWKSDQDEWKDGPMKAYGLKESDFL